ncbi:MAG: hypothetical protein WC449_05760 [Candidatus Paceibacterota bacterium]
MTSITRSISFEITPLEAAAVFWSMNSKDQANFFNELAFLSESRLPMQLQYITEDDVLSLAGRRVMQEIGEYSHWGLSCNLIRETNK